MGSCGCSGGMKGGRPCGCANCKRKYNRRSAKDVWDDAGEVAAMRRGLIPPSEFSKPPTRGETLGLKFNLASLRESDERRHGNQQEIRRQLRANLAARRQGKHEARGTEFRAQIQGIADNDRLYEHPINPSDKLPLIPFNPNTFRIRTIGGQQFTLLREGGSGMGGSGPYARKSLLQGRAAKLRRAGYNARVIKLANGHTLWLSGKMRLSPRELGRAKNRLGETSPEFIALLRSAHSPTPGRSRLKNRASRLAMSPTTRKYAREDGKFGPPLRGQDEDDEEYASEIDPDGLTQYYEVNYTGKEPTLLEPKLSLSAGKKAHERYEEMLETFWPSYWMGNTKHTDAMDGWVMHNDNDDPLYEIEEIDPDTGESTISFTNADFEESDINEAFLVEGSFEEAVGHFWDGGSVEIAEDAPDWVKDEYVKHMPTGKIVTRGDLASGNYQGGKTQGSGMMARLTEPQSQRFFINSYESDIAGGFGPDDEYPGTHLPKNYELYDYMKQMPDNFHMFLMPELDNHTLKGDMITTQYARLGDDSPSATFLSKKVIVGDPDTWIQPEELGPAPKFYAGKRSEKRYNHLQWWSPGSIKIVDSNENGVDDRVE